MKFSLAALLFAGVALAANHTVMVGSGGFVSKDRTCICLETS